MHVCVVIRFNHAVLDHLRHGYVLYRGAGGHLPAATAGENTEINTNVENHKSLSVNKNYF